MDGADLAVGASAVLGRSAPSTAPLGRYACPSVGGTTSASTTSSSRTTTAGSGSRRRAACSSASWRSRLVRAKSIIISSHGSGCFVDNSTDCFAPSPARSSASRIACKATWSGVSPSSAMPKSRWTSASAACCNRRCAFAFTCGAAPPCDRQTLLPSMLGFLQRSPVRELRALHRTSPAAKSLRSTSRSPPLVEGLWRSWVSFIIVLPVVFCPRATARCAGFVLGASVFRVGSPSVAPTNTGSARGHR